MKKNKKGSLLAYSLLMMFFMLAVGISITSSVISNQKNASMDDSAKMSLSAAEHGVENFKIHVYDLLKDSHHDLTVVDPDPHTPQQNIACQDSKPQRVYYMPPAESVALRNYEEVNFYDDETSTLLPCPSSLFDVKSIDSIGHYKDSVRAISAPVYLEFRDKDLLARWIPKEKNGSNDIADSSGNGNDGELKDGLTFEDDDENTINHLDQNILDFGSGDYMEVNGDLGKPKSITIFAWIKRGSLGSNGSEIVSLNGKVGLKLDNLGNLEGYFWNHSSAKETNSGVPVDTSWHSVAYTYKNGEQKIYIDKKDWTSSSYSSDIDYGAGGNTIIGKHPTLANAQFRGSMRAISVYGRALSKSEINLLHNGTAIP